MKFFIDEHDNKPNWEGLIGMFYETKFVRWNKNICKITQCSVINCKQRGDMIILANWMSL